MLVKSSLMTTLKLRIYLKVLFTRYLNVLKVNLVTKEFKKVEERLKKMTKTNIKRLKLMFDHKDGVSQRQAAKKFNCTQQHINKIF